MTGPELLDGWVVFEGHDLHLFGSEAPDDPDLDALTASVVDIGFIVRDEDDDNLVTMEIANGAFVNRRLLLGRAELLAALRMAGILEDT